MAKILTFPGAAQDLSYELALANARVAALEDELRSLQLAAEETLIDYYREATIVMLLSQNLPPIQREIKYVY